MKVRPLQILIFSLVPLALAFLGIIGGSFHGSDSAREHFEPAPTPRPGGVAPAADPYHLGVIAFHRDAAGDPGGAAASSPVSPRAGAGRPGFAERASESSRGRFLDRNRGVAGLT